MTARCAKGSSPIPLEKFDMTLKDTDLEFFERKFAMYMLLLVDNNPMSTKTDLVRMMPGNEKTKFLRLKELEALGFIELVESEEYSTRRLMVTEKAKPLVRKVKKLRYELLHFMDESHNGDDTDPGND